jgi:hypothetical protein
MAELRSSEDHWAVSRARVVAAAGVLLAATATAAGAGGSHAAVSTPAAFHVVFDGKHNAALLHEGTFTTSSSFCASGTAADISVEAETDTAVRRFSCSGSAGTFTARVTPLPAEHGGLGSWQIVDGSGPLAELRGKGTWTSTRLSGRPDDPASITFRSTWDGVADLDTSPPTIAVSSSSARKLRRPKGAYTLRVVLSFGDAGGSTVSYRLVVVDPRKPLNWLATKSGETATGAATSTLRVRPVKNTRILQLKVVASDAVGNEATLAGTVRLR